MQREFWLERWQLNQIGFHSEDINPYLPRFWPDFKLAADSRVLVPLCGKSKDMLWLKNQGHAVAGVELSPLAVEAFFAENRLKVNKTSQAPFTVSQAEAIRLYCGDFFDLRPAQLDGIDAVFDRAALVALPPALRKNYVNQLRSLLKPGVKILLVAFDYDQDEMPGPPFCVPAQEIEALYGEWCAVTLLCTQDITAQEPKFRERGLSSLREQVYALTVNN